jgi:flavin-dependent dehydrogenase
VKILHISAHYGAMAAVKAIHKRDLDLLKDYDRTLRASDIYKHPYLWPTIKENYQH